MRTTFVRLLLIAALFAVLFGAASFLPQDNYSEAQTIAQGAKDFDELSERFESLAKEKGAVYAFEVLKRAELPPNTDLHLLGHTVGDELYKQEGLVGIAHCTEDFRNACSHSIVIGTLNERGPDNSSVIETLRAACTKAPGGSGAYTMCFHGLGHGVFAYFGYSLPETVAFCRKTGTPEYRDREFVECVGGAVMELMGGGGHDHEKWLVARERYLTGDPLSPCMSSIIPSKAKEICLTYLTPRLLELAGANIGHPDPATFPKAFGFCESISLSERALRKACLGGFGKDFVPLAGARDIRDIANYSDEEFALAISWCMRAPTSEGRSACVAEGLSSVFWGGENDPEASFRFCSLVADEPSRGACYERLVSSIASYIHDGTLRSSLCARLPEKHRTLCLSGAV